MRSGANKGLVGASLFMTGPTVFDMRTPMRTLADLKGKKIRVLASPFQTEQIARLGGTGVPMTLGDVLPALQQGTLDGAMGALPVFAALQYYDSAKYMTETGHAYIYQHRLREQAVVRRLAGRSQGRRDENRQAGRGGDSPVVDGIFWLRSARSGSRRAAS